MTKREESAQSSNPGLISGVIGMVAPAVIRTIPMDDVVEQLDVNAIAERLDLDALMARLDMDALVDRLDVNAIADQLDLDALMARLDMDALVDRLDVNAIANMLDLDALMKKIDMGQITAGVTGDVAVSGLDLVRRQLVRADATVDGVTDRILRRQPGDRPVAPARLEEEPESEDPDTGDSGEIQRRDVSGHYAGPVTRLLGLAGDFSLAFASWGIFWAVTLFIVGAGDRKRRVARIRWLGEPGPHHRLAADLLLDTGGVVRTNAPDGTGRPGRRSA